MNYLEKLLSNLEEGARRTMPPGARTRDRMPPGYEGPQLTRGGTRDSRRAAGVTPENDTPELAGRHSGGRGLENDSVREPGKKGPSGDLRGLGRGPGRPPHPAIQGRKKRSAVRRRASGLPLESEPLAGPKGKLPGPKPGEKPGEKPKRKGSEPKRKGSEPEREDSHTVYQDMGYLMAEAFGLISEKTRMAKEVEKKGLSGEFKTAGGETIRGGSLVRKASIEKGGALRPGAPARDEFGRTKQERARAASNTRSRGGEMAKATDKEIAHSLATRGTRPLAKPGSPAAETQKRIETKNKPFSPMMRKLDSAKAKAKKIAAERKDPKTTAKRDK